MVRGGGLLLMSMASGESGHGGTVGLDNGQNAQMLLFFVVVFWFVSNLHLESPDVDRAHLDRPPDADHDPALARHPALLHLAPEPSVPKEAGVGPAVALLLPPAGEVVEFPPRMRRARQPRRVSVGRQRVRRDVEAPFRQQLGQAVFPTVAATCAMSVRGRRVSKGHVFLCFFLCWHPKSSREK